MTQQVHQRLQPHFDSQLQDMKQAQPVNHQENEHPRVTLD
jgi:hypothetical protein